MPETILLIYCVPNPMGSRSNITSEALGVFDQVDIFTLDGGVQEAKVGITVVAPRQVIDLISYQQQMR